MYSILLGLIMSAVGWLVVWSVYQPDSTSKYWWPFAMKEPPRTGPEPAPTAAPWRRRTHARLAKPATRPWQRRSGS